jgi:hypothetical protein
VLYGHGVVAETSCLVSTGLVNLIPVDSAIASRKLWLRESCMRKNCMYWGGVAARRPLILVITAPAVRPKKVWFGEGLGLPPNLPHHFQAPGPTLSTMSFLKNSQPNGEKVCKGELPYAFPSTISLYSSNSVVLASPRTI